MNKQEAIEQLEWNVVRTTDFDRAEDVVVFEKAKEIISQIHEPQKVVVPQFVAEWIEECKRSGWHLQKVLSNLDDDEKVGDWAYDENDDLIPKKVDMIARAWLDGYEVESEQLYTVEIPNPNNRFSVVFLTKEKGKVHIGTGAFFGNVPDDKWKKDPNTHLTESEIKQDFEWAWQWAEAVEVE
ncbi:DUF1642 domain-containing protein [Streptococcus suis]|uniref:DUF1642 domain-containing protein n=1 Tax=Streptococcus suis TaxID=1307 RepID=UPI00137A88A2|nr:DUF1642 domain-containing protein [Streptococcus suis]